MQTSRATPGTRLRKTLRYPSDSDSDTHPELDEQEQETLIRTLATTNATRNIQYRHLLLLLPLLSTLPYLLHTPHPFPSTLLPLTSLLATFLLIYRLPPDVTGFPVLDSLAAVPRKRGILPPRTALSWSSERPLDKALPWMNLGVGWLAGLVGVLSMARREEIWWHDGVMAGLPLMVFGVVVGAKMMMASVDPEAELSELKYNYKGA